MTTTKIYAVRQDEEPIFIGECKNAWRGAMYVWNDIAKRYFRLEGFPSFDEKMQSRIWNAGNEYPLTEAEKIVLASTMDKAIVEKSSIIKLIIAFDKYSNSHTHSSIFEQSKIIEASPISDGYALAWVQTSVCDGWFKSFDANSDKCVCDLTGSFDVIQQIEDSTL